MQVAASTAGASKKAAKPSVIATISFAHVVVDQVIARSILSFEVRANVLHCTLTRLLVRQGRRPADECGCAAPSWRRLAFG